MSLFENDTTPENYSRETAIMQRRDRLARYKAAAEALPAKIEQRRIAQIERDEAAKRAAELQQHQREIDQFNRQFADQLVAVSKRRSRMTDILREVAAKHGMTPLDITGPSRVRIVVAARQEFMFRASKELHKSLPEIGRFCGGRDHTTVLHGIRRHAQRIAGDDYQAAPRLHRKDLYILACILRHVEFDGWCRAMRLSDIGDEVGLGITGVSHGISRLVAAGYLIRRRPERSECPNEYRVKRAAPDLAKE